MTTLQFADTHNLVAFLAKPAKSEGFEQIVDFLNAHTIKHALTVNTAIYTSCIEQYWATVKVKTVNGEVQLQALVDGKKIIVIKAFIRSDLQLNDEKGMDCLPNATIFEELTRMGAKTTAWNEFSSTMASVVICLATNQKFNFSKYIFESMVKNLDNAGKLLMYPRFVQVFSKKQPEGMKSHKRIYVTPSHTKKISGNMRRVGKGFSGRDTPLYPAMTVQAQQEQGEDKTIYEERDDSLERVATTVTGLDVEHDRGNINKTQSNETPNEPSSPGTSSGGGSRRQETMGDTIAQTRSENVSKLSNDPLLVRVIDLENTKTAQDQEITSLKLRVKKLEKKGGLRTHKLKILYKGRYGDNIMFDVSDLAGKEVFVAEQGVPDSKKDDVAQVNTATTTVSTASIILVSASLITDVEITLAQALAELKSAKPTTATSTRSRAKGLVIHEQEQARIPIVSSQQPSQEKIQDKGDELEQESIKKQKVDEDKETVELKSLMEVIPDEEEVAVDAIPLATKPPSIVDWKIHKEGKKSYYQIIRADGSSKMYLVFSHMLKSFDREDLETLYKLVKAKYGSTRPVEDLDLVLYGDLKTMFDPHVEDQVWKNQSDYRVLEWKLYDSCGVHSLRKQNVHIHMLVEKRYPLTAPTITDMLNKKLKADHWNEMCYQLLKLITK
ncbi:hypothetical protein Tco_0518265 [Tanacetum coccineum]